jgi:murein DD-endopeptidase MepM/ murein hydrolase activator NlpD
MRVADAMQKDDAIATTDPSGSCSWCKQALRPYHHYVQAGRSSVFLLCSEECLRAKLRDDAAMRSAARRRNLKRFVFATSLVAACITPHLPPLPRTAVTVPKPPSAPLDPAPLPGAFGPEWPPSEASLLADLGRDAWLHPLAGPIRRMPARDSRVFGADRPGDRPIECRKGHCGVDLGGEIWGEQVRAAHDGVVDRVQRGPNDVHGGHYVRIAHRNGSVFTQYFHLAAIPRQLQPGSPVKAGDVIGLLGDTGVKESTPHLHFTVSVRPASNWPEQYVDPEPLIALWPLRIPLPGSAIALVSIAGMPGVPLGGAPISAALGDELARLNQPLKLGSKHDKSARRRVRHAAKSDGGETPPSPAPSSTEDEAEPESDPSE